MRGLARAVELLQELSPGIRLVGGLADQTRADRAAAADRAADLDWLARKLGREVDADEVRDILERLAVRRRRDRAGRVLGHRAVLARHQRHLASRTIWWKKSAA